MSEAKRQKLNIDILGQSDENPMLKAINKNPYPDENKNYTRNYGNRRDIVRENRELRSLVVFRSKPPIGEATETICVSFDTIRGLVVDSLFIQLHVIGQCKCITVNEEAGEEVLPTTIQTQKQPNQQKNEGDTFHYNVFITIPLQKNNITITADRKIVSAIVVATQPYPEGQHKDRFCKSSCLAKVGEGFTLDYKHRIPELPVNEQQYDPPPLSKKDLFKPCGDSQSMRHLPLDDTSLLPQVTDRHIMLVVHLLAQLSESTIRGVPIIQLLRYIHRERGTRVPIMIVGGAIRDTIKGKSVNDIDLAIARKYDDIVNDIEAFYKSHGDPLGEDDLQHDGARQAHGMIKLKKSKNDNEKDDDLDIGVFKTGYDGTGDDRKIICGFSPLGDASQRDFTINAIYVDVFQGFIYDPFNALDQMFLTDKTNIELCTLEYYTDKARQSQQLANDLGACLRVFKMIVKGYAVSEKNLGLVSATLAIVFATGNAPDANYKYKFQKIVKKLFKPDCIVRDQCEKYAGTEGSTQRKMWDKVRTWVALRVPNGRVVNAPAFAVDTPTGRHMLAVQFQISQPCTHRYPF